jgi:hypothetical protein
VGCGCGGKGFSNYATGMRVRSPTSHITTQRPVEQTVNIRSKSLQAKTVQASAQSAVNRRKV